MPSLDRLLLLNLRQGSFLNPSVLIRFLLYLLLLPLCLKFESRSHLLRTEQDRPGAFFGPELLHQLSATLALLLLVPESLDCLPSLSRVASALLVWRSSLSLFIIFLVFWSTVSLMVPLSFLRPEGESQQAEELLDEPLGASSFWLRGRSLLSTKPGLKGIRPVLHQLELTVFAVNASCHAG
jgi:hypothetical protein